MDETPQGPNGGAPPPPPPAEPPPETTSPPSEVVSSNRGIMIVLSYLGILALIPLLVEKDDKEVQWHAKHGLVLFVAWIALFVVMTVLSQIPGLGCVFSLVGLGLWLASLVVIVLCIVKGLNGSRFLIPGISDFADRF
jgi:uncharacterized membrane protein